ncbi:MAG: translesion DNA synthesis-associated protein ImuA [Pseudomonadota bacterium]|nr:translesion DNA synthesis-associated protein ImuA [Pseudomonadota bacterium]
MGALPFFSLADAALHGVWSADALGAAAAGVVPTGHAALDAELPGSGWPLGVLIELLQAAPAATVWPLLLPALAHRARSGTVVLVNPPHAPYAPALAAAGVPAQRLLWLAADTPAAQAWASEQALRCQDVAAVAAWLPRVRVAELRRLQQAAAQTGALLFVLRPERGADAATPARVRLRVGRPAPSGPRLKLVDTRADEGAMPGPVPPLRIDLLKRRGPPLATPLWLPACSEAVGAVLRAAWGQGRLPGGVVPIHGGKEGGHALAGTALVAA